MRLVLALVEGDVCTDIDHDTEELVGSSLGMTKGRVHRMRVVVEMTEEEYREAEEAYIRAFDQPTLTQEMVEAAPANHRSGGQLHHRHWASQCGLPRFPCSLYPQHELMPDFRQVVAECSHLRSEMITSRTV